MKKYIIQYFCLLASLFVLTGCAETEFASHIFKTTIGSSSEPTQPTATAKTTQQGNFKVGNPYNVMGKTYYPKETYSYTETGIASWYGPGFDGKKTASGERYSQHELTAAHRTLQMPSFVRVTNLENGKSVIVRVNDRGPFSRGRIIDVSEKAAKLLGMIGPGTAKVKLEMLAEESKMLADAAKRGQNTKGSEIALNQTGQVPSSISQQQPVATATYQPTGYQPTTGTYQTASVPSVESVPLHMSGGVAYPDPVVTQMPVTSTNIYVQAGAFGQHDNAQRLGQKLQSFGVASHILPVSYQGRTLYRVRLGPVKNVPEADILLKRVLASGHSDALIIVD